MIGVWVIVPWLEFQAWFICFLWMQLDSDPFTRDFRALWLREISYRAELCWIMDAFFTLLVKCGFYFGFCCQFSEWWCAFMLFLFLLLRVSWMESQRVLLGFFWAEGLVLGIRISMLKSAGSLYRRERGNVVMCCCTTFNRNPSLPLLYHYLCGRHMSFLIVWITVVSIHRVKTSAGDWLLGFIIRN